MAIPNLGNVSDVTTIRARKGRRANEEAQPLPSASQLTKLYKCLDMMNKFKTHYVLRDEGFRVITLLVDSFVRDNKAYTVYGVNKILRHRDENNTKSTADMLGRLEKLGLVEVIGYGFSAARIYAPTRLAVKSITKMSDMLSSVG